MPGRVVRGIDPGWLRQLVEVDPIPHLYAVWDLENEPGRVDFLSLYEDGAPVAYALIWRGRPGLPIVHWSGLASDPQPLVDALPPRPLVAVVPDAYGPMVARSRGPAAISRVLLMACDRPLSPDLLAPGRGRRLRRSDLPALRELANRFDDPAIAPMTAPYATLDPEAQPAFGVFEGGQLVAVARVPAVTPRGWVIGGVFTVPEHRGRGYAREVTRSAVTAAVQAGARPALFVKEENLPARRVYDRLGFVTRERRAWVDCTGGGAPPNAS